MSVYHVPNDEWPSFVERFTQQHRGERLTVRHHSRDGEDVARGCFDRLVLDTSHGDPRLWAFLTEPVGVTRLGIERASEILFEQDAPEVGGQLHLASADGEHLDLLFDEPLVAGELDGVTPSEKESA